jgi:hypothetical protein
MPDPRSVLDFTHIDPQTVTFNIDNATITYDATQPNGSTAVGYAVMLSAGSTVALTNDGARVLGKLMLVEWDGRCTVQTGGFMKLAGGNAATLTVGEKVVGALGTGSVRGFIRAVATGTAAELGHAHGTIIDATDATNVVVRI